jgi:hypothetical protein
MKGETFMDGFHWPVFGLMLGAALAMIGGGIVYAYGKGAWDYAPGSPILRKFMLAAYACLGLGGSLIFAAVIAAGDHLAVPSLSRLPVALYYGAALGVLMVILTYNVLHHRVRIMTAGGGAEDEKSLRVVRVHANFTEYVPLGLGLLILIEWAGAPSAMVHFGGGVLTAGRYLHAYGYTRHPMASFGRIVGIQSTLLAISFMAACAVYYLAVSGLGG